MAKFSLKESLRELTISNNLATARREVIKHLVELGFEVITNQESSYKDRYGQTRKGYVPIVAKKGKRSVAIAIDSLTPKHRTQSILNNYDADYRLVLLRGGESNYIIDELQDNNKVLGKYTAPSKVSNIHVLSLRCYGKRDNRKKSRKINEDNYNEYQRKLFDVTYTHLASAGWVPTFRKLFNTIAYKHPGLIRVEGAESVIKHALNLHKQAGGF